MNKHLQLALAGAMLFGSMTINAMDTPAYAPAANTMSGDYVIINYTAEGNFMGVSNIKSLSISSSGQNLTVSDFTMAGCKSFKAAYDAATGTITIPSNTQVYNRDGVDQKLLVWSNLDNATTTDDIEYTYRGFNRWVNEETLVVNTSDTESSTVTPYFFSDRSMIVRADATSKKLSYYHGNGTAEEYNESFPCYMTIKENKGSKRHDIEIFNLFQSDQYGYGCMIQGWYTADGNVTLVPQVIGQANDRTYKILAGCTYDYSTNKPTGVTDAGKQTEGIITGRIDLTTRTLTIDPMAIFVGTATTDNLGQTTVKIDTQKGYYEAIRSISVTYDDAATASITTVEDDNTQAEPIAEEYFTITGQKVNEPMPGTMVIKRTRFADGSSNSEKLIVR